MDNPNLSLDAMVGFGPQSAPYIMANRESSEASPKLRWLSQSGRDTDKRENLYASCQSVGYIHGNQG